MTMMKEDFQVFRERDPAARSAGDIFLNQMGLHAIWHYRGCHWLWQHKWQRLARWLSTVSRFFTMIEIHPGADIGRRLFIDHGSGIVIGETTIIGNDCSIYQGTTLGGTSWQQGKRHPTLGNNVIVGAGAKILGPIDIGDNARVGSNAVVTRSVGQGETVVGVPARVVKKGGTKINCDFEQYAAIKNLTDPLERKIKQLETKITALEKKLSDE